MNTTLEVDTVGIELSTTGITLTSIQQANPIIEVIQKDSIIEFNSIALQGFDGAKGDKGDKGDPFLYSDLTPEQKTELAGYVEVDNAQFTTDLLANYILNKE